MYLGYGQEKSVLILTINKQLIDMRSNILNNNLLDNMQHRKNSLNVAMYFGESVIDYRYIAKSLLI